MNVTRIFLVVWMAVSSLATAPYHQGFLTFSPGTSASSYVCPGVSTPGGGIALNPVDFGSSRSNQCGKCIQIVTPRQFSGNYPVVNVFTQGQAGDIDLCNVKGFGRFDLSWKYAACKD